MDIPGAFARPGCVARCCRDVLDELTFDPLFERRDENLDAILAPADLTMLLLRDQEWGNDTPRTERARSHEAQAARPYEASSAPPPPPTLLETARGCRG